MEWYVVALIVVAVIVALQELSSIRRSAQNIDAMMQRLLSHHSIEWQTPQEPSAEVRALAQQPDAEIEAIRAYRQQTGLGIKEAQAVVRGLREGAESAEGAERAESAKRAKRAKRAA